MATVVCDAEFVQQVLLRAAASSNAGAASKNLIATENRVRRALAAEGVATEEAVAEVLSRLSESASSGSSPQEVRVTVRLTSRKEAEALALLDRLVDAFVLEAAMDAAGERWRRVAEDRARSQRYAVEAGERLADLLEARSQQLAQLRLVIEQLESAAAVPPSPDRAAPAAARRNEPTPEQKTLERRREQLLAERATALKTFTPLHPKVRDLDAEREEVERRLAELSQATVEGPVEPSHVAVPRSSDHRPRELARLAAQQVQVLQSYDAQAAERLAHLEARLRDATAAAEPTAADDRAVAPRARIARPAHVATPSARIPNLRWLLAGALTLMAFGCMLRLAGRPEAAATGSSIPPMIDCVEDAERLLDVPEVAILSFTAAEARRRTAPRRLAAR